MLKQTELWNISRSIGVFENKIEIRWKIPIFSFSTKHSAKINTNKKKKKVERDNTEHICETVVSQ